MQIGRDGSHLACLSLIGTGHKALQTNASAIGKAMQLWQAGPSMALEGCIALQAQEAGGKGRADNKQEAANPLSDDG